MARRDELAHAELLAVKHRLMKKLGWSATKSVPLVVRQETIGKNEDQKQQVQAAKGPAGQDDVVDYKAFEALQAQYPGDTPQELGKRWRLQKKKEDFELFKLVCAREDAKTPQFEGPFGGKLPSRDGCAEDDGGPSKEGRVCGFPPKAESPRSDISSSSGRGSGV